MMFYTYSHHKPDGTPFYIGKGCRKRSFVYQSGRRFTGFAKKKGVSRSLPNIVLELRQRMSEW